MRPSVVRKLQEVADAVDWRSPALSFRRLYEAAARVSELMESNVETSFGYLLRSAVQEFANDAYKDLPVIYPNFITEIPSRRRSEIYGGLYRPNLPRQVDAGEKFQDTSFKGFEREITNFKFGHIETFERELFDDDQTGQVRARSANMGEGFKIFEEIYTLSRLLGLARTEEGVDVPASTYNNGTDGAGVVYSATLGNRPTPYVRLSATALETAHITMRSMTDPLGRKFLVTPVVLLVSPIDEFTAYRIINSPIEPNTTLDTKSMLVNPLQNRYKLFSTAFIPEKAWMIGDPKRGFVFQRRDPLEIVQENQQSGDSFRHEVYAFRARERFECDWVEPRFAYLGDDGSV